jgi:hypothetical protein
VICPTHKNYKGRKPTKRDCPWCHLVYELAVIHDLARAAYHASEAARKGYADAAASASTALYVANKGR